VSYDYVKRTYGVDPRVGQRVMHQVTKRDGTIAREDLSAAHYVQVRFDGQRWNVSCHPKELDYL
jgi:membrane protein implicated in regulation of membrane protease activity